MARRNGKKGDYLVTDDYTGFTKYASNLRRDYWGNYATKPLQRNLQEIAKPLNDPRPVSFYRGSNYEVMPNYCLDRGYPFFVGLTNVQTKTDNAYLQALDVDGGIGVMEIECDFYVQ